MIRRIGPVQSAAATRTVPTTVRRSDKVPQGQTGGIAVVATEPQLLTTLGATVHVSEPAEITRPTSCNPDAVATVTVERRRSRDESRKLFLPGTAKHGPVADTVERSVPHLDRLYFPRIGRGRP